MAAATATSKSFGIVVTGGVDATTVSSQIVGVKRIVVTGGAGGAGAATITDTAGTALGKFVSSAATVSSVFDMGLIRMNGIKVTLGAADDSVLFITE